MGNKGNGGIREQGNKGKRWNKWNIGGSVGFGGISKMGGTWNGGFGGIRRMGE